MEIEKFKSGHWITLWNDRLNTRKLDTSLDGSFDSPIVQANNYLRFLWMVHATELLLLPSFSTLIYNLGQ